MAEELRLALILLGALAIGSVILHGIWTVRKTTEQEKIRKSKEQPENVELESQEDIEEKQFKLQQMEINFADLKPEEEKSGLPVVDMNVDAIYQQKSLSGETEAESEQNIQTFQTEFGTEKTDPTIEISSVDIDDEDIQSIDINSVDSDTYEQHAVEHEKSAEPPRSEPSKQEVFILFVTKPDGEAIEGARLLPTLLTLGFKFGEMDFFHRHQDSAGNGPILFSIANMYNPGTFDVDNMEQMSTRGLSIFMTLPNGSEPLQTFNMMHNAAKKIAEEFDATVLDENRKPLEISVLRQYVERIRNF